MLNINKSDVTKALGGFLRIMMAHLLMDIIIGNYKCPKAHK